MAGAGCGVPGRLGMVREHGRISAVRFLVTASAQPRLIGRSPCFGVVVSDRTVVTNLSQVKTHPNGRPIDPPVIERIRVFAVGEPEPLPEPVRYRPQRQEFKAKPRVERSKTP